MRWRTSYFWALGAFVALAVLAFDGRPNVRVDGSGAVSAPSAPIAFVGSAPAGQVLLSHLGWCGHALRSYGLLLTLRANSAGEGVRQFAGAAQPHYGPLHRRPPPSFS
jgi:hypothetical protein